jgi:hypothetical protein
MDIEIEKPGALEKTMRMVTTMLAMATLAFCVTASGGGESRSANERLASFQTKSHKAVPSALQANSLCARTEHIIFSCRLKHSANRSKNGPAKIASLCASPDVDKEHGYLQYRYGRPGKIELEFPKSGMGTQQMFQCTHYMRYQVDLTEINFEIDGYEYQIFGTYNGEEKPMIAEQGVSVSSPGKPKEVSFVCRGKAKADYSSLQDVLPREQEYLTNIVNLMPTLSKRSSIDSTRLV